MPLPWSPMAPFVLAACASLAAPAAAQWPANFTSETIGASWQQPVGVAFAPGGTLFVWEKSGRVWSVVGGVKSAQPVIDLSQEVGDWRDYGCLGFAVDPDFATNGRVYAGYVVDYHHLRWFGTPTYSPTTNQYFRDTIARVTRFALDPQTLALVPGSRTVLIGESMTTGIPICNQSHGIGSLAFGEDGTLLVTAGDGAAYEGVDDGGTAPNSSNTALADGIIRPKEDVGAFRSQLVDSLSGKILRIDPETGNGVRSNPFFDSSAPRAPRSRVWALGLRNPYRMSVEPGTGSPDPAVGDPGTIWLGDVGWNAYEELDVCEGPAQNFGWPIYEGLTPQGEYLSQTTRNQDAPNPLFGSGGCNAQYFAFRDLLVQDTLGVASWPNPCNAAQQVPAAIPRFEHTRPILDWGHGTAARAPTYTGVNASVANVGAPGSPIQGAQFSGNCATGGAVYSGTQYPASYVGSYFVADYVSGWLRRFVPGNPAQIAPFATGTAGAGIVFLACEPGTGTLHYIRYAESGGGSEVRRVVYTQNLPPIVVAAPDVSAGPVPFAVQFSSAGTVDPEGQALSYLWDFGDGTTSALPHPLHVYEAVSDVTGNGAFIGRILELSPPHPLGSGSQNPQILRDGDRPPVGAIEDLRQYDTFHNGAQGNVDWLGYAFPVAQTFRTVVFQEGKHFANGGWFEDWRVEVGDATTWTTVAGAVMTPPYAGNNGVSYETYRIDFPPTPGTRIRLIGNPGGSANYVSAGELRILADDPMVASSPVRRDVTLTVRDPLQASASVTRLVSLNNTPPVVTITSPVDGSLYAAGPPQTIPLSAVVTDAEHTSIELECAWQTVLHHDEHTHPEPIDANCATSTVITSEGCDGHDYHFEVILTVTDAAGLSTTVESALYPDCVPVTLCAGDGSGAACPCGNAGAAGRGCENSLGTGGGLLAASGAARTGGDTLSLAASGLPPLGAALFFQGDDALASGAGVAFGDGLRCAGGSVRRLAVVDVVAGAAALGHSTGASLSALGLVPASGAVRVYQSWYRNAASFCTSAPFNLTNGVRITWVP